MAGRGLRPDQPWPTRPQPARKIARLVGVIGFLHFALAALQNLVEGYAMALAWLIGGMFVGYTTIRIETYFQLQLRQQR